MGESKANLRQMQRDLDGLLRDLEVGEAEMKVGPITEARGKELEAKAHEAQALQDHIDRYNRISGVAQTGRELQTRTLPATDEKKRPDVVRTTPGHLFVTSEAFQQWKGQDGAGWSAKVDVRSVRNGKVALYGDEAEKFKSRLQMQTKQYSDALLSDLYAAIWSQDDPEIVRYAEPEILTIRDVMNVVPCTSDSIRFVRHTATGRAAAAQQLRSGTTKTAALKNYLTVDVETETVNVCTIAVLSKVTEQDIEDAPRLIGIINGEMQLDVRVEEETELLYGTGVAGEINGLYNQGVEDVYEYGRAVAGETLIDAIRKVRTDLRKRRVVPNACCIDPLDWETVELEKGTDERYVWGLISDLRGPRIWSMRVVESDAMTNPDTGERRVLVGDWTRGATLYDRHDVRLAVGYVDDDFARNLRTLRAEERLALAVKRPWAFEYIVTDLGGS
jgi:HK97 family phage major capsid protein